MTDPRIAPVEDNLLEFFHRASELAVVDSLDLDDVAGYHSDVASPLFNVVFDARFAPGSERERAHQVLASYLYRELPFLWWTTPSTSSPALEDTLVDAGLMREDVPGMHVGLDGPVSRPVPDGVDLQLVTSETADSMIVTMMAGFGMPAELSAPMGAMFAGFTGEDVVNVLATVDGVPAGTGTAFLADGTAGLYNIATTEVFRGRGVGYAVTAALMDHARDRGCAQAVLHASAMGRPVYERLGFEQVCDVPQFVWLPEE